MYVRVLVREVLWPQLSHLTSRHLCLPQLYQHIPAPCRQAGRRAEGRQCVRNLDSGPSHTDWLGVCVNLDGGGYRGVKQGPAPLTKTPLQGIQIIPLHPQHPPLATVPWVNKQPGSGAKQSAPPRRFNGWSCLLTGGSVVPHNPYHVSRRAFYMLQEG